MALFEGHATKRQRTEVVGRGVPSGTRDRFDEQHKHGPSPVVLVGGLNEAVENDVVEAMRHFGAIGYVKMLTRKGQSLVEFEDLESAKSCVEYIQAHPNNIINVAGNPAFFDYYSRQRITRPGEVDMEVDNSPPNRVILITVLSPKFPMDTQVLKKVTEKFGTVLRVVMIRKHGVQSMVEFESVESATEAKRTLHGRDIYSGCCTLKIEYARPQTLTVRRNDSETYDFSTSVEVQPSDNGRGPALLEDPPESLHNGPTVRRGGQPQNRFSAPQGQYPGFQQDHSYQPQGGHRGGPSSMRGGYDEYEHQYGGNTHNQFAMQTSQQGQGRANQGHNGSQVVMVYGMNPDKMNCDKLFNLLCLYGNVWKIKFMKSKPGCAMVEMGDPNSVGRAISYLSNIQFFDKSVQLAYSNQMFLASPPMVGELPDSTEAFKDFSKSRNNRFMTEESAAKNRIQRPGTVLHFFNCHPQSTEESIKELFGNAGAVPPESVKLFEVKTNQQSVSGLAQWENQSNAIEGLILGNHTTMENPSGRWPYIFKLCFSSSPSASVEN